MGILDRYIARQLLGSTLMAVAVLSVVLVLGQIFKQLLDRLVEGVLPFSAILKFVGYAFPSSLSYTLPWGLLTAVLLTFGRLSADNELVAMRMSGRSLLRICAPVFIIAALLSGLCYWINTVVAPHAIMEIRRMTRQAVMRDPTVLFAPDKTVTQIPGFPLYVGDREGDRLSNLQIFQTRESDGKPDVIVLAKEARITPGSVLQRKAIEIVTGDTLFLHRDEAAPLSAEEQQRLTAQEGAAAAARVERDAQGPPAFFDTATRHSPIPIGMSMLVSQNASVKSTGLSMEQLRQGMEGGRIADEDLAGFTFPPAIAMRTEYHRRISFSLACLVLALAGIPFGISAQRRETSSGFLISLVIGIGYFSIIMLGDVWRNKPEKLPWLWVWVPNVIFGVLGVRQFLKLQRK